MHPNDLMTHIIPYTDGLIKPFSHLELVLCKYIKLNFEVFHTSIKTEIPPYAGLSAFW